MRDLFRGTFRSIPAAILVVALLLFAGAGAVLAAGYILTDVDVTLTVPEPISIYYGPSEGSKANTMGLEGRAFEAVIWPGACWGEWLLFESAAPHDLLLKATVEITGPSTGVSITFWDNGDEVDLVGEGVTVNSTAPMSLRWKLCIPGDADPGLYAVAFSFARESPNGGA